MRRAVNFLTLVFCLATGAAPLYAAPQDSGYGRVQKNNMNDIGKLFEKADANHDGMLTRKEAESIPVLSAQFNDMDINQNGEVTRQEMLALMKMKKMHHGRNTEISRR